MDVTHTIITAPDGSTETLRATHAALVLARIRPDRDAVAGSALAAAAWETRATYRCRTVRKELRRVALLAETAGDAAVTIREARGSATRT